MKKMMGILLTVLLGFSTQAIALERFDIVTTQELKQMLDDREAGKTDFVLVNALEELIYNDSSIPGSINIPWGKEAQTAGRLGGNKDKLIISY